jgi:hypothetical protein
MIGGGGINTKAIADQLLFLFLSRNSPCKYIFPRRRFGSIFFCCFSRQIFPDFSLASQKVPSAGRTG